MIDKNNIYADLVERLEKSQEIDKLAKGIPMYKVLLHLLDAYNSCCFYGDVVIRINGTEVKSISHDNVSVRLEEKYCFDEDDAVV